MALDCAGCGACCLSEKVSVIHPRQINYVPEQFIDDDGNLRLFRGCCSLLDLKTAFCTQYQDRPVRCRLMEAGSVECLTARLWAHLTLDWFGERRLRPVSGSLKVFRALIVYREGSREIDFINGYTDERSLAAIAAYNAALP